MMRRLLLAVVAVGFLGLFGARPAQSAPPAAGSQCVVHTIDVGQGAATLVQTLDGKNILFDTGWDWAGKRLVGYLKKLNIDQIDALVITHRHMDHIGGVKEVANNFAVKKVIGPWDHDGIPVSAMVHLAHLRQNLGGPEDVANRPVYEAALGGKVFTVGSGCDLETVWPPVSTSAKPVGDMNEESVVMRVVQKSPVGDKASFLVGGDLVARMERHLARTSRDKIAADWMVANHHGSRGSTDYEYLAAVSGGVSRMMAGLLIKKTSDTYARNLALRLLQLSSKPYFPKLVKMLAPTMPAAAQCVTSLARRMAANGRGQALGGKPSSGTAAAPPSDGDEGPLDKFVAQIKEVCAKDPKARNRIAIFSVGKNSYGHPNTMRLALTQIAGFTPMTTQDQGTITMTRKVGADGKWDEAWTPQALGHNIEGVPEARPPAWLVSRGDGLGGQNTGYGQNEREADYNWSLRNPHPTVSWDAPWDTTVSYQTISKQLNKGKTEWTKLYVYHLRRAKTGDAESKRIVEEMRAKIDKPWHGRDLTSGESLVKWLNEHHPKARQGAAAAAKAKPTIEATTASSTPRSFALRGLSSVTSAQPARFTGTHLRPRSMQRLRSTALHQAMTSEHDSADQPMVQAARQ